MTPEQIPGASVWDQEMYDHLTSHGPTEGAILGIYQQLADDPGVSPAFRFLAGIILEDERRHHALFATLAETIRHGASMQPGEAPVPSLAGLRADRDRIVPLTDELLQVERDDARVLKDLGHQLKDYRDTTMWSLLVQLMEDDTAKHIKILQFIRDRALDHY
jgi:hypothetical protein